MPPESSHDDNRKKVCGPCGKKITFGTVKQEKFLINKKTEQLIQQYVSSNFNLTDEKYPVSICKSCSVTLSQVEQGIFNRNLQNMPKYNDIVLPKKTRSTENVCDCYICLTARFKGHIKIKRGRGNFKDLSKEINITVGYHESQKSESPSSTLATESIKLCSKCLQEIGKGKQHACKDLKNNILNIVDKLPEKTQEQLLSTIIKKKLASESDINEKLSGKNIDLNLSTGGRNLRVAVNPDLNKSISFDEESLDNLKNKMGLSSRKMIKFTNFLRCTVGRKSVPLNYRQHMKEKSNLLKDVYKTGMYEFECEKSAKKELRPVVYADAGELLEEVIIKREVEGNITIKVMADGGQGFLKISLTVLPENYSLVDEEEISAQQTYNDPNYQYVSENNEPKKRKLYSEGGTLSKKGKLTSVDFLIILCVVPDIKETYDNMKILFDLTNLNSIPFKFVSDFKLLLIVNGQQTATSAYPCPYCFVSLHDLRGDSDNSNTTSTNQAKKEDHSKPKTYGDLRADFEKYCLAGRNKKFSKDCHSTINLPLFSESDETYVLEKCIIPELHVLQGFVNHLFWKGLVPLLTKEKALLWPRKLNLVSKNYHGDAFEGNACRTLLKNADLLNNEDIYKEVGLYKVQPYIAAYKAMNKVVNCSFTSGKVGPSLDIHIKELQNALKSIDKLSETLKIHVILSHIEECLQFIDHNNGLGYWSEQSGESIHHQFLTFWERNKVSSIHNDAYLPHLLKTVIEFSSVHL